MVLLSFLTFQVITASIGTQTMELPLFLDTVAQLHSHHPFGLHMFFRRKVNTDLAGEQEEGQVHWNSKEAGSIHAVLHYDDSLPDNNQKVILYHCIWMPPLR